MTQQQTVNFLPEDYVEKRAAARSAVVVVGLFVLELAGIMGGYWYLCQRPLSEEHATRTALYQEREAKARAIDEYNQMRDQKLMMQGKVELMAQLMERVKRNDLLRRIHAALGKDTKLTFVDLKTKEVGGNKPATKLEEARNHMAGITRVDLPKSETTVEVMGLAPSHEHVAVFLEKLGKVELVEGAQPVFSEDFKVETTTYRRFKVAMKINPAADTRFGDAQAKADEASK